MALHWRFEAHGYTQLSKAAPSYWGDSMGVDENELNNSSSPENRIAIPDEASALSLESAFGSVKPSANPECFDVASSKAKDEKAEKTARELSGYHRSPARTVTLTGFPGCKGSSRRRRDCGGRVVRFRQFQQVGR